MTLLSLKDVSLGFGGPKLLDGADLQICRGERICLVGRNGAGKSTLLKVLHGELTPDRGTVARAQGLKTALLPQEAPREPKGTVYDIVASGQPGDNRTVREENQKNSPKLSRQCDEVSQRKLNSMQRDLDTGVTWQLHRQIQAVISRMGLDEKAESSLLSAGHRRRVHLARVLLNKPDILLLDEPTNHLDIDAILWMEDFLLRSATTLIFVSHDRIFINKMSTRIVELDRGRLTSFPGNIETYRDRKEELIGNEESASAEFNKKLMREETWLRQGVKARRTRNEGRVKILMEMRDEVRRRRTRSGNVRLLVQEAERSGRLVADVADISLAFNGKTILSHFSTTIMRGDKIGIIGPNGCGKTTLLRMLLGEISPDSGAVKLGTHLEAAYFDQLREKLDESKTLQENVADKGETVFINGKHRHIIGYLKDFLFSPAQARAPISALSGGERNRLLLARLFTKPSNLLVLDEPTNDLDAETLELVESMLIDYGGTVLVASHDRAFLNNVVSSTLVFEGEGRVSEHVGGYDDWQRLRSAENEGTKPLLQRKKTKPQNATAAPRKLTFKEQRELDLLPEIIETLEEEKLTLYAAMADPALYKKAGENVQGLQVRLDQVERDLETSYARWELLEELSLTFKNL
ncbi:MAG: ATP-binding cassette domain-containing protein [Deltaproteobacteria bacterium]|nr:ATP-binding cassette domain-containing protein [Deltaproteobacteria bacterium]